MSPTLLEEDRLVVPAFHMQQVSLLLMPWHIQCSDKADPAYLGVLDGKMKQICETVLTFLLSFVIDTIKC